MATATTLAVPIQPARDHWRGGADAPVTLLEYGDYECPYSRLAFREIQKLEQELGAQLRFVYRHFPLTDIHPNALGAARFAEAAARQGSFWPAHELLFHRQKELGAEALSGYAAELGLDQDQLERDLADEVLWEHVSEDAASAEASGARGTPTLFLNGTRHTGSYDRDVLRSAIEALE